MSTRTSFILMVIFAFASVIAFFQINSVLADNHHLNALFTIGGIVCGLVAIYFLSKVIKQGGASSNGAD